MAFAGKVAQLNPAALTATKLYTVGAATTFVGRVVAANRDTTQTTIRISVRIAGAGADNKQFIVYDLPIDGNDTYQSPVLSLAATDEIWVYDTDAFCAFTVTGLEFS